MRTMTQICDEIRRRDHFTCQELPNYTSESRRQLHGVTLTIAEGIELIAALEDPVRATGMPCVRATHALSLQIGPWVLIPTLPGKVILMHVDAGGEWMETDTERLAKVIGEFYARHF